MDKIIDVAAAVMMKDGLIMVARRAKGEHLEQKWEFPGGKIEPDETTEKLKKSLNLLTSYTIPGISEVLLSASEWNIR